MILEFKNEFADIFEVKTKPIIKDKCYLELMTLLNNYGFPTTYDFAKDTDELKESVLTDVIDLYLKDFINKQLLVNQVQKIFEINNIK